MSFLPFTRKPKPLNPGPINEDWAYGDLAERIVDGFWGGDGIGPEKGDVCKVLGVVPARAAGMDGWFLGLSGFPGQFEAGAFRKVPPLNSAADTEFAEQIKRLKPAKVKA